MNVRRVVGDVLGKYHPHGDAATYEALVRMAQDFSMRYTLIDGQGNFGSVDGDSPAAYRYTECRLERIASEMLADIDMETVDFVPNYDGKELEPLALPTRIPNLLINGSSGIAVGMATNIPPHNLSEVIDACQVLLNAPEATIDDLIKIIPAPDFPTRGIVYGVGGVKEGDRTGRGRVVMRARTHFEEDKKGGRVSIVIDELPYQVNKANLLMKIGEMVREKRLDGISDIRDESDKSGMRAVIELKRGENPEVILNNLWKETQMEDTFGMSRCDGGRTAEAVNISIARSFPAAPRESGSRGARCTSCARRAIAARARRAGRGAVQRGRGDRADQGCANARRRKSGLMARFWRSRLVEELLARVKSICHARGAVA